MRYFTEMGWLTDWRRRRVLRKHRLDEALWPRLPFLPDSRKLKDLALLFLAEKQLTSVRGLQLTDAMRVSIAAQACLPILELGLGTWLDPYASEHPSEFFAVISEAFFEDPKETRRRYPDVYEQLKLFYRQDPA